jgi:hypothetical protein
MSEKTKCTQPVTFGDWGNFHRYRDYRDEVMLLCPHCGTDEGYLHQTGPVPKYAKNM